MANDNGQPTPEENLQRCLESPSYLRAYEDLGLLHRVELRPVRLQLELMKPELLQQEQGIESTVVLFGSSRTPPRDECETRVHTAELAVAERPGDEDLERSLRIARSLLEKSHYYEEARRFAQLVSTLCQQEGRLHYVICTGGGPGIMEGGNRGAWDVGAKSIGMNITLPHEQAPNSYITPELCFQFHYFAVRKMQLLLRAKAAVFFPGGFGTCDELFETLTLVQTKKMKPIPILLFGEAYWRRLVDWDHFVEEGVIGHEDLGIFRYCETAEQAWELICDFHETPELRPPGRDPEQNVDDEAGSPPPRKVARRAAADAKPSD